MSSSEDSEPPRLTPAMSSRRLQVLDFIRNYIAGHNEAPSLSEIANGCGIARSRAHQQVRTLIRQGHLMRRPGMRERSLMLPSAIEEAKRRLREAGYRVDEDFRPSPPCTIPRLPALPALDYLPDAQQGGIDGDSSGDDRHGRMGTAAPGSGG